MSKYMGEFREFAALTDEEVDELWDTLMPYINKVYKVVRDHHNYPEVIRSESARSRKWMLEDLLYDAIELGDGEVWRNIRTILESNRGGETL